MLTISIERFGQNITMKLSPNKSLFVTGATGFVGKALLPKLLAKGFLVRALIRKQGSYTSPKIDYIKINDLAETKDLTKALLEVDVVIHLAARVHIMSENHESPLDEYRGVNVQPTINLARQAASLGVKRFIFISSAKVNGELTSQNKPFRSDDQPSPRDPYSISKMEAENALIRLSKETDMEIVIIRPPIIYGPGVKANFLRLIKIIDKGIPLPFGSVQNLRSMVFIDNMLDLIIRVIDHPDASGEIFLVSDDEDVSTKRLINHLSHELGRKARLIRFPERLLSLLFKAFRKSDMSNRLTGSFQLDIMRTKEKLGWNPPVNFEQAIKITIKSYLKQCSLNE